MHIWIDDRVGSRELHPILSARGVSSELSRLEFADFAFEGIDAAGPILLGVERKNLSDFVQSCRTGRFPSYQLPGLLQSYDRTYLVVEGVFRSDNDGYIEELYKGRWRRYVLGSQPIYYREMLDHWLDWQEFFDVRTITSTDMYNTAEIVYDLARQWNKPYAYRKKQAETIGIKQVPLRSKAAHAMRPTLLQRMLAQISSVGPELSLDMATHFRTMESVLAATEREWQDVPGIGPVLAKRIWKELHPYAD